MNKFEKFMSYCTMYLENTGLKNLMLATLITAGAASFGHVIFDKKLHKTAGQAKSLEVHVDEPENTSLLNNVAYSFTENAAHRMPSLIALIDSADIIKPGDYLVFNSRNPESRVAGVGMNDEGRAYACFKLENQLVCIFGNGQSRVQDLYDGLKRSNEELFSFPKKH